MSSRDCLSRHHLTISEQRDQLKRPRNRLNSEWTSFNPQYNFVLGIDPWLLGQTKIRTFLLNVKSQIMPSARLLHFRSPGVSTWEGSQTEWNSLFQEDWMALSKGTLIQKHKVYEIWPTIHTLQLFKGSWYLQHPIKHFVLLSKTFRCK